MYNQHVTQQQALNGTPATVNSKICTSFLAHLCPIRVPSIFVFSATKSFQQNNQNYKIHIMSRDMRDLVVDTLLKPTAILKPSTRKERRKKKVENRLHQ